MKLCKACNQSIPKDFDSRALYCGRQVCIEARKSVARLRYKRLHPYSHYDERTNWICRCPEMWVVPAQFNSCSKCGAIPRNHYAQKQRVFIPKKHGVDIRVFIDEYSKKKISQ